MAIRKNPTKSQIVHRGRSLPSFLGDDLFTDMWRGFGSLWREVDDLRREVGVGYKVRPFIETKEEKDKYLVRAELPGFEKDEVKVEIDERCLCLRAEHKEEKWDQDEKEGWRSIETRRGDYYQKFTLPEDVIIEKITAEMKDGVLRLTLPREEEKKKQIKEVSIH